MAKFEKGIWAIKDKNNKIFLSTIRLDRRKCIDEFIKSAPTFGINATHWISFRRRGYEVVRIKIELYEKP